MLYIKIKNNKQLTKHPFTFSLMDQENHGQKLTLIDVSIFLRKYLNIYIIP